MSTLKLSGLEVLEKFKDEIGWNAEDMPGSALVYGLGQIFFDSSHAGSLSRPGF